MTRNLVILGCMWVTAASLAMAQYAPPAPPAPAAAPAQLAIPDPPEPPMPAPAAPAQAPTPKAKPAAAPKGWVVDNDEVYNLQDWGQNVDAAQMKIDIKEFAEQAKAAAKMSIDAGQLGQEIRDAVKNGQWDNINDLTSQITEKALAAQKSFNYQDYGKLYGQDGRLYAQATPPAPPQPLIFGQQGRGVGNGAGGGIGNGVNVFAPGRLAIGGRGGSEDRLFASGETNLDNHNLDNALVSFNEVISRGGSRADGALYYKAFTLNKMGRRDDAQAAINELRKSYAGSKWLEDAKMLEADVKAGKSSSDEDDIKVMAINGLMQSDPEKAFPILEGLIKGAHIPRLKRESVMVLAQNSSPRAQTLLEQIARGTVGDPDQQVSALRYVVDSKSNPARAQLLMDVYSGAPNDASVRGVVIRSFENSKDFDHLGQIVKTEKNSDLRESVIHQLGEEDGQPQLWALYSAETTPDGKRHILGYMHQNGNVDKLAEIARTEKDATIRKEAVRAMGSIKGTNVTTSLIAIYINDSDPSVKKQIINDMSDHKDARSLIDMYRKEKDVDMRRYMMGRIINIHAPEVNDFLLEILK